jgi:hypothetical protein
MMSSIVKSPDPLRRHWFHAQNSAARAEICLSEPDVHLPLDPEFDMDEGKVPGHTIGAMPAAEVNVAGRFLAR